MLKLAALSHTECDFFYKKMIPLTCFLFFFWSQQGFQSPKKCQLSKKCQKKNKKPVWRQEIFYLLTKQVVLRVERRARKTIKRTALEHLRQSENISLPIFHCCKFNCLFFGGWFMTLCSTLTVVAVIHTSTYLDFLLSQLLLFKATFSPGFKLTIGFPVTRSRGSSHDFLLPKPNNILTTKKPVIISTLLLVIINLIYIAS